MTMQEIITQLCDRYLKMLRPEGRTTEADRVTGMLETLRDKCGEWPVDKSNRWLGFIQCTMIDVLHLTTVDEERDFTRPMFHAHYKSQGLETPASVSVLNKNEVAWTGVQETIMDILDRAKKPLSTSEVADLTGYRDSSWTSDADRTVRRSVKILRDRGLVETKKGKHKITKIGKGKLSSHRANSTSFYGGNY